MQKKIFIMMLCLGTILCSNIFAQQKPTLKKQSQKHAEENITVAKNTAEEKKEKENSQIPKGMPSTDNPIEGQMTESKETNVTDKSGNTQKVTTVEYF